MKCKILVTVLFSLGLCSQVFSQRGEHNNALEVLGGITKFGTAGSAGYVNYFAPKWYFKLTGFYSDEVDRDVDHYVWGGDLTFGYSIIGGPDKKFNLSAIVGFTASQESGQVPGFSDNDFVKEDKFGGLAGLEIEYYFTPRWSLVAHADQHIVGKTSTQVWGYHRYYIMGGIRYHFHWGKMLRRSWCD